MKIIEVEQATADWFMARKGIPTASRFDKILTPKTLKLSASMDDLIAELIAERFMLAPAVNVESYMSRAMVNGVQCEPEARKWYELERNVDIQRIGFAMTEDERFGCSPDGLIGDDGGIEIKCPTLKTQVSYLLNGGLPAEYLAQVHGSLIVTGRKWWDFLSYAHGLPKLLIRVESDSYTDALRAALEVFWVRYQEALKRIESL